MWTVIKREPVVFFQAVAAFVEVILAAIIVFGFDITAEQKAVVVAVIIGMGQMLAAVLGRSYVTPTADARDEYGRRMRAR